MTDFKKRIPIIGNGDHFSKGSPSRRILKWVFIIIIALGILLFAAGSILSMVAKKRAETEFKKINGTFASLNINLFNRSVTVTKLAWEAPTDLFPTRASMGRIRLRGISLFQLLFNKRLYATELRLDSGFVSINQSPKKDTTQASAKKPFPFEIENIILRDVFIELRKDSLTEVEGLLNVSYGSLKVDSLSKIQASCQSVFNYFKGDVTNIKVRKVGSMYTSQIDKIGFDSEDELLYIDSLKLIPNYGKYEFGNVRGKQVSRLQLSIRQINVAGLNYKKLFDSLVSVKKLSVHVANLHSFRDKRVPFKNGIMELPMKSLEKLSFALEIDSIAIDSTMITIEEFAEEATQSGRIHFQNLSASMVGLSNRYYINKPKYSQLDAEAKLMGSGFIKASFRFPLDGSPLYSAKGKLSTMPLVDINTILENSAKIRIESGKLNELYFNFSYTDLKSTGAIEINYENLKLTSLNSDKEKSTNVVKTAIINTLIKNTKDESVSQSKRTGVIDEERDRRRFVFNLWWKSIQSGLKSSFIGDINAPNAKEKSKK